MAPEQVAEAFRLQPRTVAHRALQASQNPMELGFRFVLIVVYPHDLCCRLKG